MSAEIFIQHAIRSQVWIILVNSIEPDQTVLMCMLICVYIDNFS